MHALPKLNIFSIINTIILKIKNIELKFYIFHFYKYFSKTVFKILYFYNYINNIFLPKRDIDLIKALKFTFQLEREVELDSCIVNAKIMV